MDFPYPKRQSWLDRPLFTGLVVNAEVIVFSVLLILAVASRFADLGARVMSHDENSHVYYSWLLYKGQGYTHDPITHGPLQFHLVALSYFLFGDNDMTARIPAALFSAAAVAFVWFYRRYLGRAGVLIAGGLMLISPYMLFYGRYVRNEAFVALFGLVTLYGVLRYLETGQDRFMFLVTTATVLHFTAKETAFIYTAQVLIFLALFLIYEVNRKGWQRPGDRRFFLIAILAAVLALAVAGVWIVQNRAASVGSGTETAAPAVPGQAGAGGLAATMAPGEIALFGLAGLAVLAGLFFLVRGYTWRRLKTERSFGLLVVLFTLVLPMMAPFPVKALGINPIDYSNSHSITLTAIFVVLLSAIALAAGMLWNARRWAINAAIFYAIFTVFYTTVFTNGFGFVTGLVGSLGYWLEQQGVNRGSQPLYYYALIQVPVYEYLPALGSLLALLLVAIKPGILREQRTPAERDVFDSQPLVEDGTPNGEQEGLQPAPVVPLLGFWAITSLLAYTFAGEKMPWLTVHITLPMILLSGWSLGYLVDTFNWETLLARRGWLVAFLLPVFLVSALTAIGALLGANPPFQGKELEQLRATSKFVTALAIAAGSGWGIYQLTKNWAGGAFTRLATMIFFAFLALLTVHTAVQAAYIHYDDANELMVYAHSAPGVKLALAQIEEIALRTTDGFGMPVAYDSDTSYPYWWYLRNFTDQRFYGKNPTRSLREVPVILVGEGNFGTIDQVVGQAFNRFDYIRLWWPNQDYFNLTWDRIANALKNPAMREAIFQIWLNRDYKRYGEVLGQDLSLPNWSPSSRMRLYIRKDVIAKLWNYGSLPGEVASVADPYEGKGISLQADQVVGEPGAGEGQLNNPRGVALAPDGSIYVADTGNNRIQHYSAGGQFLGAWGSFADVTQGEAPGGTFNQPWGITVASDGSVYVADTWNYRIQKFTPDGSFLRMWGVAGQAETPDAFWGPRSVAVDSQNRVYVTDTGNKRVVVFDQDGNFLSEFGEAGLAAGQFDEPVGVAADSQGRIYVADTWNQRIQVFVENAAGGYLASNSWDVAAWYGQSVDNKPYLAVDPEGHVFATDPLGYRVLEFTRDGNFIQFWGIQGTGNDSFGLAGAVAADANGVWVSDSGNNRLMHFKPPHKAPASPSQPAPVQ